MKDDFLLERAQIKEDKELTFYLDRLDSVIPKVMDKLRPYISNELADIHNSLACLYQDLPKDVRINIINHPFFCYYWVKLMEIFRDGKQAPLERWIQLFSRHLVIPFIQQGCWPSFPIPMLVYNHEIRFPGHPRHIVLPNEVDEIVYLSLEKKCLLIKSHEQIYTISVKDLLEPTLNVESKHPFVKQRYTLVDGIELDAGDLLVEMLFNKMNSNERYKVYGYDLAAINPLSDEIYDNFQRACALLKKVCPDYWEELLNYTKLIVPYTSKYSSTFTESNYLGAVFMSEKRQSFSDEMYTAEHLLHEQSHLRLTLVLESDPIFFPEYSDNRYVSPFRQDQRPMLGIVHGAFVFSRMAVFLARGVKMGLGDKLKYRLEEVIDKLDRALEIIRLNCTFTDRGESLMAEMQRVVDTYQKEFNILIRS
ncbi:HEXXH motif-containing putative peptide modification protein [Paenibacillus enshidis]|uniref:HEXXH motif-containing putative peptide modification protein n=1 Tax=Paenibacillus enshidis TaxID=1458439 RepID=A0ABV5B291_9BACL